MPQIKVQAGHFNPENFNPFVLELLQRVQGQIQNLYLQTQITIQQQQAQQLMIQQRGPLGGMSNNGGPESGAVGGSSELLRNFTTPPNVSLDFLDSSPSPETDVRGAEQWSGTAQMRDPTEDSTMTLGSVASSAIGTAPQVGDEEENHELDTTAPEFKPGQDWQGTV